MLRESQHEGPVIIGTSHTCVSEAKVAIPEEQPEFPSVSNLPDLLFVVAPRVVRLFGQQIEVSERTAGWRAQFLK